jgi:peptidoglycan/LPS O-acetylase OafA/YrhL
MAAGPDPARETPERFPLFDGLRALAALSVLVFHASLSTFADVGNGALTPYVARLNIGVAVFFVISGFLLYRPMLAARTGRGPRGSVRAYASRRLLRIVPAYWVALTLLSAWPGLLGVRGIHWWIYYGFLQGYSNTTASMGIGPGWTLGCELAFYALLPLLSLAFERAAARRGRGGLWWQFELAALAALSAGSVAYGIHALHDPATPPSTFAATFGWFAVGMALAIASVLAAERGPVLARWAWLGWPVATAAYVVICDGLHLTRTGFDAATTPSQVIELDVLSGIVAAGLALPAAFELTPRTPVGRLLAHPIAAWLGVVSYGIYLYHAPLLIEIGPLTSGIHDTALRTVVLVGLGLAAAVAAAAASYYVVERPMLQYARARRMKPLRAAREPA